MESPEQKYSLNGQARRFAWGKWILIAIVVGYIGVLILTPLTALLASAFEQGAGVFFRDLFRPDFLTAFGLTLWISLVVVVFHSVLGTVVAWVMVRHEFRGKRLLGSLIDLPFAISPVVVGYMLLLLFGRNGLLGPLLTPLNIRVAFAVPGMVIATLFVTLPFMIRELMPVLAEFDTRQELAAKTLGASGWQTFWRITFPALRWGFFYGLTLTFARALGEFGAVLVVGGGIQGRTETATIYIYRALEERQYVGAYGAALLLGLVSLLLVFSTELLRRKRR